MAAKPPIPLNMLMKAVLLATAPALLVFAWLAWEGSIDLTGFLGGYGVTLLLSTVLIYPFVANLQTLNDYVRDLSEDRKVKAPRLGLLNSIADLSGSLAGLHQSWLGKKQQMERIITEREILVDTLPNMLLMLDAQQRILRTNRAARALFGQSLAGRSLKDVIDSDVLLNGVAAVAEELEPREVEFHLDGEEPRELRANIARFPIASEGGLALVITLNDVTQLKRVEQMRADFVANASHEIRTPLASIRGFIETLRGPAKDDVVAREEFLKIMDEQALRMTQLISDLLSLSKIEMKAHIAPTDAVDMGRVLHAEREYFERPAGEKKMTIRLDFTDNLPQVRGDLNELRQVAHNLIGNAIKYGSPDTEVTISARVTSNLPSDPNFARASRALVVAVRDRGEGISREHLPRLTERFYRVDSARTRKVGGTGLGLAIVKHILNRHRGSLTVDSVMGQGSTFSFYVPLHEDH